MTEPSLPVDAHSTGIQVLAPAGVVTIDFTGTTARVALTALSKIVMISTTVAVWVAFGTGSIVATNAGDTVSFLIPGGGVTVAVPAGSTNIAAIRETDSGTVCVTRLV